MLLCVVLCSWLIAIAYWLAGGFIKSGLGNRIAYSMVRQAADTQQTQKHTQ